MIIADLVDHQTREWIGRVYLSGAPFPGDIIERDAEPVMVIRRAFLNLGPDVDPDAVKTRLSLKLNVRPIE